MDSSTSQCNFSCHRMKLWLQQYARPLACRSLSKGYQPPQLWSFSHRSWVPSCLKLDLLPGHQLWRAGSALCLGCIHFEPSEYDKSLWKLVSRYLWHLSTLNCSGALRQSEDCLALPLSYDCRQDYGPNRSCYVSVNVCLSIMTF